VAGRRRGRLDRGDERGGGGGGGGDGARGRGGAHATDHGARYAEHAGCRRSFLPTYFGQDYPGPCGNCDNDLAHAEPAPGPVPFAIGARVVSERWGEGTVQRYDGDRVTVLFDEYGYRELFVPLVLGRGLLRPF
jgi:ATP-dependent DNA helicase RecQ